MRKISPDEWRIILIVSAGVFMTNIDASIVNVALPTFSSRFGYGVAEVSRVVLSYFLAMSGTLMIFGKLCDNIGARKIFTSGFVFFTITSVLCGLAPTFGLLTAFRFFQGMGGAMLLSSFGALVVLYLPKEIHGRAFGYISLSGGVGFALGAPLGGLIIRHLQWPWIFFINLPIGLLTVYSAFRYLPESKTGLNSAKNGSFDWPGAVLSFFCLFILVACLNGIVQKGHITDEIRTGLLLSLILAVLFAINEKMAPSPLLDFKIFRNADLLMGLGTLLFLLMTFDGLNLLFPFYLELVKKLPPHKTGLFLMIFPILSLFISPLAGHLTDRHGSRAISIVSTLTYFVSILLFTGFRQETGFTYIILSFAVFGIALAAFFTANTSLIMGHAPVGKEGMITALSQVCLNLGGIIGINLFSYVFTKNIDFYRPGILLADTPPEVLSKAFGAAAFVGLFTAGAAFAASISAKDANSGISHDLP